MCTGRLHTYCCMRFVMPQCRFIVIHISFYFALSFQSVACTSCDRHRVVDGAVVLAVGGLWWSSAGGCWLVAACCWSVAGVGCCWAVSTFVLSCICNGVTCQLHQCDIACASMWGTVASILSGNRIDVKWRWHWLEFSIGIDVKHVCASGIGWSHVHVSV
jgi:hypothetical protein